MATSFKKTEKNFSRAFFDAMVTKTREASVAKKQNPVISRVLVEEGQQHDTRRDLFERMEKLLGRPVVTYYTSFSKPVIIEDTDAEMIEGILQQIDLGKGLALIINSPGGQALAADRIINICRSYSQTSEYWALAPGKAKSAATLICFGASKIMMGPSSELGPVDPQYVVKENDRTKGFSAYNLVKSYEELFKAATESKGHLEPYLQQLQRYDAREIAELKSALALSEDLAVKALKSCMLKPTAESAIRKQIKVFLNPEQTKSHGRPIYHIEAAKCGLRVELVETKSELWRVLYELHVRTLYFVETKVLKCIESKEQSFVAGKP